MSKLSRASQHLNKTLAKSLYPCCQCLSIVLHALNPVQTLTNGPKNLVQDGIADGKVSDVDATAVGLVLLQLGPQGSLHKVLVVVGVGNEDVVFEVPVFREAIQHTGKRVEADLKILLLLLQDQGKEADKKVCKDKV